MWIAVEKISAITLRASDMAASVRFYRDVLGMELLYGGETAGFSSLHAKDEDSFILNLEQGHSTTAALRKAERRPARDIARKQGISVHCPPEETPQTPAADTASTVVSAVWRITRRGRVKSLL